ncbi:hypothetical protein TrVGV298_006046 [Trichoderma virens]|nr:hypothetical protein TrVGV298_006046 [Trichoderma virens]
MAVPLFIFTSTICRFIADRRIGPPPTILNQLLIDLRPSEKTEVIDTIKGIIGAVVILFSPLSAIVLSNLLSIPADTVHTQFDLLHSVLDVPTLEDKPVKPLHQSFRDFLLDIESRENNPFWIDKKQAHAEMAYNCLQEIIHTLSSELQYACLYWVNHVQQAGWQLLDGDQIHVILQHNFLHWLEALSLMGRSSEIIDLVDTLRSITKPQDSSVLTEYLDDAHRLIVSNFSLIESWPLQIYSSLLVFAPKESRERLIFEDRLPSWLSCAPETATKWDACIQTLQGHEGPVNSIDFSHDSKLLISGSGDTTARLWLAKTGRCLQELRGHSKAVTWVSISHDSILAESGSCDQTIRIWHVDTGSCIRLLEGHSDFITTGAFSHDSTNIVSGSHDKTIRVWNTATGECLQQLIGHDSFIRSVDLSSDSALAVSASYDGIRIWDVNKGSCKGRLVNSDPPVYATFSHQSECVIAYLEAEEVIRIWRVDTGQCVHQFQVKPARHGIVLCISWSPDSALLATGSTDGIVRICDLETGEQMHTLGGHDLEVSSLEFSNSSDLIASASRDCTVRVWSVATGDCLLPRFNTNVGSIDIRATEEFYTTSMTDVFRPAGYGLSVDGQWITWNGSNLLKLPADYRPVTADIAGSVVVFGSKMWKTIYLSFDTHKLPRKI